MIRRAYLPFAPLLAVLAGCAAPTAPVVDVVTLASEPLYSPERVKPGRLEYAPDRSTFAPVLTERFTYPTQPEANAAYRRLVASASPKGRYPASVWLFGCQPGGLDEETARVTRYRGPVVHCASDYLDGVGRRQRRETANFFYYGNVWNMQPVHPPLTPVPWLHREASPKDLWWWVPGRSRYE